VRTKQGLLHEQAVLQKQLENLNTFPDPMATTQSQQQTNEQTQEQQTNEQQTKKQQTNDQQTHVQQTQQQPTTKETQQQLKQTINENMIKPGPAYANQTGTEQLMETDIDLERKGDKMNEQKNEEPYKKIANTTYVTPNDYDGLNIKQKMKIFKCTKKDKEALTLIMMNKEGGIMVGTPKSTYEKEIATALRKKITNSTQYRSYLTTGCEGEGNQNR